MSSEPGAIIPASLSKENTKLRTQSLANTLLYQYFS